MISAIGTFIFDLNTFQLFGAKSTILPFSSIKTLSSFIPIFIAVFL